MTWITVAPKVSEVQSELRAAPGVNSGVVALSRGFFERSTDDEFCVSVLVWLSSEQVTAHVCPRGQPESVKALLGESQLNVGHLTLPIVRFHSKSSSKTVFANPALGW